MSGRPARVTEADKAAAKRLKALWLEMPRADRPTQQALADAWVGNKEANQSLISQYMNGVIPLNYRAVMFFARALGLDESQIRTDLPEQQFTQHAAPDPDWTAIKGSAQGLAAGGGVAPDEYAETHKLMFRASSLRKKRLKHSALEVHYARGDSMLPRIKDGDALLIDKSDTRIRDGQIYWIKHEDHDFVKILHKAGDTVVIESMNKALYPKPTLVQPGEKFEVVGRVRWIGSWED